MHIAKQSAGKPDKLSQGSSKLDKLSQSSMGNTLNMGSHRPPGQSINESSESREAE